MKKIRKITICLAASGLLYSGLCVLTPAGSGATPSPTMTSPAAPGTSYLWSLVGSQGSLKGPSDSNLTLTIASSPSYLTRFTDRPLRQAFVVANTNFVQRWNDYFYASAPNAVLAYSLVGSSQPRTLVLTISRPRWNSASKTWTFHAARILRQVDNLPGSKGVKPPRFANPARFTNASLFIDPATKPQTITDAPGGTCADWNAPADAAPGVNWSYCSINILNVDNVNLAGANLTGANFPGGWIINSNLTGANLSNVRLTCGGFIFLLSLGNLSGSNLTNANFAGAYIPDVDFTNANLTGSNLTIANFTTNRYFSSTRSNTMGTSRLSLAGISLHGNNSPSLGPVHTSEIPLSDCPAPPAPTWRNTTCPDGTNSDNDGGTCLNNLAE